MNECDSFQYLYDFLEWMKLIHFNIYDFLEWMNVIHSNIFDFQQLVSELLQFSNRNTQPNTRKWMYFKAEKKIKFPRGKCTKNLILMLYYSTLPGQCHLCNVVSFLTMPSLAYWLRNIVPRCDFFVKEIEVWP